MTHCVKVLPKTINTSVVIYKAFTSSFQKGLSISFEIPNEILKIATAHNVDLNKS